MQKNLVVWLGALLCCALWGSAFSCIKIGYQMFAIEAEDVATQILFAGCRFTLAGVLTILFGSVMNRNILFPQRGNLGKVVRLSMLQTVAYTLWGILLKYNPISKVAVFGFMNPVFGVILSAILLREADSLGIMSAVALVFVCFGIYIVNYQPAKQRNEVTGQ